MSYRLSKQDTKKGTYLTIQKKFWDREKRMSRSKHYEALGYLHDLQKEFPDPIAHYKEIIAKMNVEEKGNKKLTLEIDLNEKLPDE